MSPRISVDAWDPAYAAPFDPGEGGGPTGPSMAQLVTDIECPTSSWQPVPPPGQLRAPEVVILVDGVRRIDARLWLEDTAGYPGVAASFAAGAVRCDLARAVAQVVDARVARGLFSAYPGSIEIRTEHATYPLCRVVPSASSGADPLAQADLAALAAAVQPELHRLEAEVSAEVRAAEGGEAEDDLLILDGPLRGRTHLPRTLGYLKTHRAQYLPADLAAVVDQLAPGQRTPLFLLGTTWHRYSWYLRLPGPAGPPWAGVVRVEAPAHLAAEHAIRLADLSALTLPRFASSAYKDPRAPQNLTPIGGLERRLRGMLGDQRLLLRSLGTAACQTVAVA